MSNLIRREDALRVTLAYSSSYSAEQAETAIRALPAAQPDREQVAFSMWKAEADRAAPNVGKNRIPSGFMVASDADREKWLGLADAAILAMMGESHE